MDGASGWSQSHNTVSAPALAPAPDRGIPEHNYDLPRQQYMIKIFIVHLIKFTKIIMIRYSI
jgi:hypothetical protein